MAPEQSHRSVELSRIGASRFRAVNVRGGVLDFGTGEDTDFTPVELLLAAIGGCSAIDVDILTSRRAVPDSFELTVSAEKIRDEGGNRMDDIQLVFRVAFPDGDGGDAARDLLPDALRRTHERLCTVSRTVELSAPVSMRIES